MDERLQKYKKKSNYQEKIDVNLDITSLSLICSYVVSGNKNIHRSNIINIKKLIDNMNMNLYKNDPIRLNYIDFIRRGASARLDFNLMDSEQILMHINGGILSNTSIFNDVKVKEISNDEIMWVNDSVNEALKYSFIYDDIDRLLEVCTQFKTNDYRFKGEAVEGIRNVINNIQNKFRQSDANASTDIIFSLEDGIFENAIRDTYNKLASPSNKIICGMMGLNEMLGGGFESQRVYCLFGLPGEGKSTTMLDLAYQIKKFNPTYKTKDPTKKPCVVYFSLENKEPETIARLCEMAGVHGELTDHNVDDVIRTLKTDGGLYLSQDSPINIFIKYKDGMSVDTSYLYTIVDDLEDQGYECICMIVDYIKRIRSVYDVSGDIRLSLGSIINEFKSFAANKDIPVITASQLNRDATKHIDEGRSSNKADLVRMLGRSQIGESMLILENLDGGFLIAPEWTTEGQKYLGIQRIKKRYKSSDLSWIYQPYLSEIKLVEDMTAIAPVYKTSLRDDISRGFNNGMSNYSINNIPEYTPSTELLSGDTNLFLSVKPNNIDLIAQEPPVPPVLRINPIHRTGYFG